MLINGEPGLMISSAGALDGVIVVGPDESHLIDAIRFIRNPDKLSHLGPP